MRETALPSPPSRSGIPARGHNHPRIQADAHVRFGFFSSFNISPSHRLVYYRI